MVFVSENDGNVATLKTFPICTLEQVTLGISFRNL